jgi:hypothetical protein
MPVPIYGDPTVTTTPSTTSNNMLFAMNQFNQIIAELATSNNKAATLQRLNNLLAYINTIQGS